MSWSDLMDVVGPLLAAVGVVVGPVLVYRSSARTSRSSSGEALLTRLEGIVAKQDTRIGDLEARERVRDDYIGELRQHIADGNPPPPPDYPKELRS